MKLRVGRVFWVGRFWKFRVPPGAKRYISSPQWRHRSIVRPEFEEAWSAPTSFALKNFLTILAKEIDHLVQAWAPIEPDLLSFERMQDTENAPDDNSLPRVLKDLLVNLRQGGCFGDLTPASKHTAERLQSCDSFPHLLI